jgi:hypothetical protein
MSIVAGIFHNMSSGLRPRVYLWVADPWQVTFLCLSKEKSPKERTPRVAHRAYTARFPFAPGRADPRRARLAARKSTGLPRILRLTLAKPGARLTRRPHTTRLGLDQKARDYPRLRCGARLATRGPKNQTVAGFCSIPVWRARASQPVPELSRTPCRARGAFPSARRVGVRAGTGEKRRGWSRHPGALSFGYFSLREQRKVPRPRCENRNYTRGRRPLDSCARH